MRMSAFGTKSMKPIVKAFQSLTVTKSRVIKKRSHEDFYSVDSGGSLHKGD
jgi:hypothetical protein